MTEYKINTASDLSTMGMCHLKIKRKAAKKRMWYMK